MKLLPDTYFFLRIRKLEDIMHDDKIIEIIMMNSQLVKIEKIFITKIQAIITKIKYSLQSKRKINLRDIMNKILKEDVEQTILLITLSIYLGTDIQALLDKKTKKKISRKELKTIEKEFNKDIKGKTLNKGINNIPQTPIRNKIRNFYNNYIKTKGRKLEIKQTRIKKENYDNFKRRIEKTVCKKKKCGNKLDMEDVKLALEAIETAKKEKIKVLTQNKANECFNCIITHMNPQIKYSTNKE